MVGYYPLSAFGETVWPLQLIRRCHAFLPFPHVDHLHPDWAIALAASATASASWKSSIEIRPQHRMGSVAASRVRACAADRKGGKDNPGCDGLILGSHGLFTWGQTQRECYVNSIRTIDQMGEFILEHRAKKGALFGALQHAPLADRRSIATQILPALRGTMSPTGG